MPPRRTKKTYDIPYDAHALTFSVYRRRPHLLLPDVPEIILENLDVARQKLNFEIWAYVVMPEHVHVVLNPLEEIYSMATINKAIKSPSTAAIFERHGHLKAEGQIGPNEFRFWQTGGGYDRNLYHRTRRLGRNTLRSRQPRETRSLRRPPRLALQQPKRLPSRKDAHPSRSLSLEFRRIVHLLTHT